MSGVFRAIAFLFAVLTFILLIVDGATSIALGALHWTRVEELVARLAAPGAIERWGSVVSGRVHPIAWAAIRQGVFAMPAVVSALLGTLFFAFFGRKRAPDFDMRPRDRRRA